MMIDLEILLVELMNKYTRGQHFMLKPYSINEQSYGGQSRECWTLLP